MEITNPLKKQNSFGGQHQINLKKSKTGLNINHCLAEHAIMLQLIVSEFKKTSHYVDIVAL